MRQCLEVCDSLRNLLPFVQFQKREKHPWSSVTFSKAKKKNTLVSGNAGDKKSSPERPQIYFLVNLIEVFK